MPEEGDKSPVAETSFHIKFGTMDNVQEIVHSVNITSSQIFRWICVSTD
jgi:hypothetical protein